MISGNRKGLKVVVVAEDEAKRLNWPSLSAKILCLCTAGLSVRVCSGGFPEKRASASAKDAQCTTCSVRQQLQPQHRNFKLNLPKLSPATIGNCHRPHNRVEESTAPLINLPSCKLNSTTLQLTVDVEVVLDDNDDDDDVFAPATLICFAAQLGTTN